jgi:O-antigen ligase
LLIKDKNRFAAIIILGVATITLAMTPGINKDSLIIPKFIVLLCLALFLIPVILLNIKIILNSTYTKILMILVLLLLIDGVLILVTSTSPMEQLVFGRMGRGLGFATFFSALLILISSSIVIKIENLELLLKGVVSVGLLGSFYACLQFLDLDIFKWDSKTNGIIGTLGNPNSLSSFTAMIVIPAVVIFWHSKYKMPLLIIFIPMMLFTLYISESTQGYIGCIIAILVFLLTFAWYKNNIIFFLVSLLSTLAGIVAILGMLGHGPLSYYLYKISVQSRGDFWRSAFATGNSHPIFGVGFDSFGDYSLKYRDAITASHPWAEYTDSAHNFYLDYLATGGYPYLLLNISLTLLVFISFLLILRNYKSFNSKITSLFCAWVVIQLQTIVNTQSITFIAWNAVISGTIIGFAGNMALRSQNNGPDIIRFRSTRIMKLASIFLVTLGLIIAFPFFNNDRLLVKASDTGNGDLLIRAVTSYPESTTKYSQASQALLESGLPGPSLFLAQKGLEFNSKSVSLWALILVNQSASITDRQNAKIKILELDPFNKEVKNFTVK